MDRDTREVLTQIFSAGVAAADPYYSVKRHMAVEPGALVIGGARYPLPDISNIYVVGAGKAARGMARAVEEILGGLITEGVAVTKDGHGGPLERVEIIEAAHPLPDGRGVSAAGRIYAIAEKAGADDLVICLLSGGASALMVLPAEGITLRDKQETTRLLLASGADIGEINCVRKHLSRIKGGRLALAAHPARVSTLIVSDVLGNDIGTIASGPTAPDETTFVQAAEILKMRGVYARLPEAVRTRLERGALGLVEETPKPGADAFRGVENLIVASNADALRKAAEVGGYLGMHAKVLDGAVQGEARQAGAMLAAEAVRYKEEGGPTPACLITGGETTVTVTGKGKGGRNQETALAFALGAAGHGGISALFAGTDGTDGPTDAAGAFADGATVTGAVGLNMDPEHYLWDNDSYSFFDRLGGLFVPGPTGTNVMDLGIILVK